MSSKTSPVITLPVNQLDKPPSPAFTHEIYHHLAPTLCGQIRLSDHTSTAYLIVIVELEGGTKTYHIPLSSILLQFAKLSE